MELFLKPNVMIQTNLLKLLSNKPLVIIVCLFALQAKAQEKAPLFLEYKKKYGDINELIISNKSSYDIFVENKKLRVLQDNYYESMILSENGILNNQENFSYSELVKLNQYEAYSIINDKGKDRKIKVTQTNEKQARQNSVFYNDVKERQLIFPNLEAGAKKVYSVQTEFVDPFLLQSFVFGDNFPILNSTFEVRTDKDINIGYRIFNDPTNSIEFSKSEKKGKYIYSWTLKDVKAVKMEPNNPGFRYFIPHINVYVKDYTIDKNKINVLDNTEKLYDYYKSFIKNLNKTEDDDLKTLSTELTTGLTSDTEKIKKIFYWVKDNIKYIAFENGYEGFIPREASLIYKRKFGDCKDMASIISSMANYAGIKDVTVSWIGTREIPYSYEQLSTPAVDNHMIAVYNDNGSYVFLDATDRETRYGLPTSFIQGKEALLSNGDTYKIITVPVVPAENNETFETLKLSLDKEKIIGTGTVGYNGFSRSSILAQIGDASNKTRFEMIKSLVLKGNNKFHLKEYTEANVSDRDKPYQINFNFDLADYAIQVDKELYINLFLDRMYEKLTLEPDRTTAFDLEYLAAYNGRYDLELPKNYTVKYLPENSSFDNALMKFDCQYANKAGLVSLEVKIKLKKILLEQSDFALWNETIKKLKNTYTQTLILTEK
ncbi:Transglutaminase-like superfamily protein [compost metagenome]